MTYIRCIATGYEYQVINHIRAKYDRVWNLLDIPEKTFISIIILWIDNLSIEFRSGLFLNDIWNKPIKILTTICTITVKKPL